MTFDDDLGEESSAGGDVLAQEQHDNDVVDANRRNTSVIGFFNPGLPSANARFMDRQEKQRVKRARQRSVMIGNHMKSPLFEDDEDASEQRK